MSYCRLIVLRVEMADPKDVIGMIHKVCAVRPHQRSVTDAPFGRLIQISGKDSFSNLVFVKPAVQSAMSASAIRMSGYPGRFALAAVRRDDIGAPGADVRESEMGRFALI